MKDEIPEALGALARALGADDREARRGRGGRARAGTATSTARAGCSCSAPRSRSAVILLATRRGDGLVRRRRDRLRDPGRAARLPATRFKRARRRPPRAHRALAGVRALDRGLPAPLRRPAGDARAVEADPRLRRRLRDRRADDRVRADPGPVGTPSSGAHGAPTPSSAASRQRFDGSTFSSGFSSQVAPQTSSGGAAAASRAAAAASPAAAAAALVNGPRAGNGLRRGLRELLADPPADRPGHMA